MAGTNEHQGPGGKSHVTGITKYQTPLLAQPLKYFLLYCVIY